MKNLPDGLYHKDKYLPKIKFHVSVIELKYTAHSLDQAIKDKHEIIELPFTIDLTRCTTIEILVENGRIVKNVFRMSYNDEHDLTVVILQNRVVKTVWLNDIEDNHKELDHNRYMPKPER